MLLRVSNTLDIVRSETISLESIWGGLGAGLHALMNFGDDGSLVGDLWVHVWRVLRLPVSMPHVGVGQHP